MNNYKLINIKELGFIEKPWRYFVSGKFGSSDTDFNAEILSNLKLDSWRAIQGAQAALDSVTGKVIKIIFYKKLSKELHVKFSINDMDSPKIFFGYKNHHAVAVLHFS